MAGIEHIQVHSKVRDFFNPKLKHTGSITNCTWTDFNRMTELSRTLDTGLRASLYLLVATAQ